MEVNRIMNLEEWVENYHGYVFDEKIAEDSINDFKDSLKNKKLLLYGMGILGMSIIDLFVELEIQPDILVDRNIERRNLIKDYQVMSPDEIDWREMNDIYLIASMNRNYLPELEQIMKSKGYNGHIFDGHSIYESLRSAKCTVDVKRGILHDSVLCHECTVLDNVCVPRRKTFMTKYGKINENGSSKMWMIGVILGQFCTLNCKHCCEAIPYYPASQREFVNKDEVINDIKHMASACKYLTTIEFVGGEPFLHPQLKDILEEVARIPNAGKMHIFTNGTVVPSDDLCELLSKERFEVFISNYQITLNERLSDNVRATIEKLKQYNVNFLESRRQGWLDFADFGLICDDEEKVKDRFRNCFVHTCNRLFKGVLYHCPHEYAGAQLGHFDSNADILHIHEYTTEELAEKFDEYKDKEFFESCKYCKLPYDAEPVLSGIQMEK